MVSRRPGQEPHTCRQGHPVMLLHQLGSTGQLVESLSGCGLGCQLVESLSGCGCQLVESLSGCGYQLVQSLSGCGCQLVESLSGCGCQLVESLTGCGTLQAGASGNFTWAHQRLRTQQPCRLLEKHGAIVQHEPGAGHHSRGSDLIIYSPTHG